MKYPDDYINKIICGNCLEVMKGIPNNSIDLIVTSPPYDNLRTYKGYTFDFKGIAKELYRITKQGGVVVWVVSDATINGSETGTSFRQALYFKEIGLNLHDTMIYKRQKAPLTHKRYEQGFEFMFIFCKGNIKTFNGIQVPRKYLDKRKVKGVRREKDGSIDLGYAKQTETVLCDNVWQISAGGGHCTKDKIAYKHPAIFPEKLAQDHIISWSNKNDIVLDPMCGSGTTCKMAKKLNRKYIGIDIGKEYCEITRQRVKAIPELLF